MYAGSGSTFIIRNAATNPSNEATRACIGIPSGTGLLGQTSVQLRKSSIASPTCMEDPQNCSGLGIHFECAQWNQKSSLLPTSESHSGRSQVNVSERQQCLWAGHNSQHVSKCKKTGTAMWPPCWSTRQNSQHAQHYRRQTSTVRTTWRCRPRYQKPSISIGCMVRSFRPGFQSGP